MGRVAIDRDLFLEALNFGSHDEVLCFDDPLGRRGDFILDTGVLHLQVR
jgi:hypothetical protein